MTWTLTQRRASKLRCDAHATAFRTTITAVLITVSLAACSLVGPQVRGPSGNGDSTAHVMSEQDHLDHLGKQADAGDAQAALWLSQHYAANGDFSSAARWKQRAADLGHPRALPPRGTISLEGLRYMALSECTASSLRPLVARTGPNPAWPVMETFPPHLAHSAGEVIYGLSEASAGLTYTLYIDMASRAAYVLQRSHSADDQKDNGPLPVASCPEPGPAVSSTPASLHDGDH